MSTEGLFNRSRVGWIHWLVVVAGHPGAEDVSVEGKEHLVHGWCRHQTHGTQLQGAH